MRDKFSGQALQSIRQEKRITQAFIAEFADTTIRYIRALERGEKTNPSAALVFRISEVLEVPVEMLMVSSDEP